MTALDPGDLSQEGLSAGLVMREIRKSYGGAEVLHGADLTARSGAIHAVVGENGAGKSTLLRIAAGLVRPDHGAVTVDGTHLRPGSPRAALRTGVAIVTQELASVPARSVLENVYLGSGGAAVGPAGRAYGEAFTRLCAETDIYLPANIPAGALSLGDQHLLEVLRALARKPRVLILDEPTASLDADRSEKLFALLRRLAARGLTIVFVSHFLDEVLSVANQVTVLRDGSVVSSGPADSETEGSLVSKMVGRELQILYPEPEPVDPNAPVVLRAERVSRKPVVHDVTLEVRAGEIVGLAGLVGAGRSEFARAVFGADQRDSGEVLVADRAIVHGGIRRMMDRGIALVPEDRKTQGLVLQRSISDNLVLNALRAVSRLGFVRPRRLRSVTERWVRATDVRGASAALPVGSLSGGNQQKVLLAKWLHREPRVLIADEPTRGVDVAAKAQIHRIILDAARRGVGVILISSEVEEVMGLAHRIVVFRHGRVVAEFPRGKATSEAIVAAAFGTETNGDHP